MQNNKKAPVSAEAVSLNRQNKDSIKTAKTQVKGNGAELPPLMEYLSKHSMNVSTITIKLKKAQ